MKRSLPFAKSKKNLYMGINIRYLMPMLENIADFFHYMSDNGKHRLYYQLPLPPIFPYAYQHSSIRDVGTICDILDLVQLFKERNIVLALDKIQVFEQVVKVTLKAYQNHYENNELSDFSDGNIGDIGFFLLALKKCSIVFPSLLPIDWKETSNRLIKQLLERQNVDGSLSIFFDPSLQQYEKSAEAFYLPEALIGLIEIIDAKDLDHAAMALIQKGIVYCCQEKNRVLNLATDNAVFYANWQFQLLYHWVRKSIENKREHILEATHLNKILEYLMQSRIAYGVFEHHAATVEIACYFEGLVHAQQTLIMLQLPTTKYDKWFELEINRCLEFLYQLQAKNLLMIHGGFVHSYDSCEARVDVAGHVFGGINLLY